MGFFSYWREKSPARGTDCGLCVHGLMCTPRRKCLLQLNIMFIIYIHETLYKSQLVLGDYSGFLMLPSLSNHPTMNRFCIVCSLQQSCALCSREHSFKQSDAYIKKLCVGTITQWLRYVKSPKVCSFSSNWQFILHYLLITKISLFVF